MTFREAVLRGCEGTEQAFEGSFYEEAGKACVLMAAAIGAGIAGISGLDLLGRSEVPYSELTATFAILNRRAKCPCCCSIVDGPLRVFSLLGLCWHLNDQHRWPRERIAAWVDTYEQPALEPEPDQLARQAAILSLASGFSVQKPDVETLAALSDQIEDGTADFASAVKTLASANVRIGDGE